MFDITEELAEARRRLAAGEFLTQRQRQLLAEERLPIGQVPRGSGTESDEVVRLLEEAINKHETGLYRAVSKVGDWHPSLQQALGRVLLRILTILAKEPHPDARNEAVVRWAREVIREAPSLPMI